MEQYTDQEQVDAIRKWWSENGKAIIGGLLLGLGGVLGWQFWQNYQRSTAEQASAVYFQLEQALTGDNSEEAGRKGAELKEDYPRSPYSALAGLALAAADVDADDLDGAKSHLAWVVEHGAQPELADVARLRLAKVLMAEGDYAAALARLDEVDTAYRAEVDEIRGDIFVRQAQPERAREAYQAARAARMLSGGSSPWLDMKLNDIESTAGVTDAPESGQ
jgi:predicted negative regulator of RcsB-dependent stress response